MLPELTAPIAVPSVAGIGEPDIPEAITESKPPLMRDRTVHSFARERHHAPARSLPLTPRRGAVPRGQIAQGDALRVQK
jgi:hypothetical protein